MHRILLVEDEPGITDALTYALTTEGMKVVACATLEAARSAGIAFDLVVLDVGLPDGSGFDFCREVREASSIPVIFLTARADEIDRVVGLEIGADDYVVKPFSPREVAARVKAVLRRTARVTPEPPAAPEAPATAFYLDEPRRLIRYHGVPLTLSRYEFRILQAFMSRPGCVFSRSQLLDLAWEEPDASFDRTVDTHVKTLRSKLRQVRPGLDPIQTHRGEGYSLKAQQ
jgi:two-component system catabolic regulation response regulator CreB